MNNNVKKRERSSIGYIWEDREIRFDSKSTLLSTRPGEKIIDSINSVEDTKGKVNGDRIYRSL